MPRVTVRNYRASDLTECEAVNFTHQPTLSEKFRNYA